MVDEERKDFSFFFLKDNRDVVQSRKKRGKNGIPTKLRTQQQCRAMPFVSLKPYHLYLVLYMYDIYPSTYLQDSSMMTTFMALFHYRLSHHLSHHQQQQNKSYHHR